MKKTIIIIALVWATTNLIATELNNVNSMEQTQKQQTLTETTFKVSGNCNMCKTNIETAAKSVDGVINAEWNKKTKIISVNYDSSKVKLDKVHQAIANVGYDTDKVKGNDDAYAKLYSCCKYRK